MKEALSAIVQRKLADLRELEIFVGLSADALLQATEALRRVDLMQEIADAVEKPKPFPTDDALNRAKERAKTVEKFAKREHENGFPYLYGLATVRLWSVLEALVDELLVCILRDPSRCKDTDQLARLKGPLLVFRNASPDEQAEFLADTLKNFVEAGLKPGVGKFEAVLTPVGLGGGVDDSIRRNLFEMSQLRNTIVHKAGRADRRLLEACPWLPLKAGDPIGIDAGDFHRYLSSAFWYLIELNSRCREFSGQPRTDAANTVQADLVVEIARLMADPEAPV